MTTTMTLTITQVIEIPWYRVRTFALVCKTTPRNDDVVVRHTQRSGTPPKVGDTISGEFRLRTERVSRYPAMYYELTKPII